MVAGGALVGLEAAQRDLVAGLELEDLLVRGLGAQRVALSSVS